MNEQISSLIDQLKDRIVLASADDIDQIVKEARAEALAEAKTILKERLMRSILEKAIDDVEAPRPAANGAFAGTAN